MVALDEQFHRDGVKARSRRRKEGFGRYNKSPTASVNSVACNYYLLQDLLYRAVALTNSSGQIVEAYDSEAYGSTLIFTAPDTTGNWWGDAAVQSSYGANEIIYCGYRFDPEAQNYYVRNRTYNPVLGRWIQRDPIGYAGGINLYGYVGSAPVGAVDADGLRKLFPPTWLERAPLNTPYLYKVGRAVNMGCGSDGKCRFYRNYYFGVNFGINESAAGGPNSDFQKLIKWVRWPLSEITEVGEIINLMLSSFTLETPYYKYEYWMVWKDTRVFTYKCGTHYNDIKWESTTRHKDRHLDWFPASQWYNHNPLDIGSQKAKMDAAQDDITKLIKEISKLMQGQE